jgi:uncharacterized damage-inducible protein DinB
MPQLYNAPVDRLEPPFVAAERAMLDSWLDFHRATLLTKCDGLSEEALKTRSVPPSAMSLLGLVRHLTEVESNWFRRAFGADGFSPESDAFDDVGEADVGADMVRFRDEVDRSRRIAAEQRDLDALGRGVRDGQPVDVSLRWIYVHMIEEYARHNGHADLLRERVDGATGV